MKVLINLAFAFLIAGEAVVARAQGDTEDSVSGDVSIDHKLTLKGVKGVLLYVESLPPEVEQAGLTRAAIQTDVELKLRLAGLTVADLEDAVAVEEPEIDYSTTMLFVEVLGDTRLDAFWSTMLNISFVQFVSLLRDPTIRSDDGGLIGVPTWQVRSARIIPRDQATFSNPDRVNILSIRNDVKNLVDEFINSYLSVNPTGEDGIGLILRDLPK
jgi:hypothetical protein